MAEISRVVVPVDFSSNSAKVVEYGVAIADKLGAEVLFFHVINNFQGYDMMLVHPSFLGMSKDLEQKAEDRLAVLVKEYASRAQGASGAVIVGDAAEEIVNYATLEKAAMIIIGSHGVKGREKIPLGSTADRVIKNSPCPVLLFNPFS